jgi:O-6-methylguanine DNA methyltransferase
VVVDEDLGTPFQVAVWKGIWSVEFGRVDSYADLAKHIDHEKATRAVGGACGTRTLPQHP